MGIFYFSILFFGGYNNLIVYYGNLDSNFVIGAIAFALRWSIVPLYWILAYKAYNKLAKERNIINEK